jgi:hypothetical protein
LRALTTYPPYLPTYPTLPYPSYLPPYPTLPTYLPPYLPYPPHLPTNPTYPTLPTYLPTYLATPPTFLPYPTYPPTLPTLPYPTLPYPTQPYPTLPYHLLNPAYLPTYLPYLTLPTNLPTHLPELVTRPKRIAVVLVSTHGATCVRLRCAQPREPAGLCSRGGRARHLQRLWRDPRVVRPLLSTVRSTHTRRTHARARTLCTRARARVGLGWGCRYFVFYEQLKARSGAHERSASPSIPLVMLSAGVPIAALRRVARPYLYAQRYGA